ncbi:chitin binding peritrophin-A domain-containing protein [Streptomyces sp. NPDC059832]|uniref:chitin binding peritrophin-A domain-containing protein n=1 Tax=Streptomyces sp. NPDC059832 TaxID=3346966 RepID=UPI00366820E1
MAYLFDCPAGLHWDTTLLTCNYPEQAGRQNPPRTHSARRAASSPDPGVSQRLEIKHIQGQFITHTIVKPSRDGSGESVH